MAAIRNSAKAVILHQGRILLNRCRDAGGAEYFDLPGGGQHAFESIEEALVREVYEETGLSVRVIRFLAFTEEIEQNEALRAQYPDYCHRAVHIFQAEWDGGEAELPQEMDFQMLGSAWVPLEHADTLPLRPALLSGKIGPLLRGELPPFLGTLQTHSHG